MKRLIASLFALPLILALAMSCDRNEIEEEESVVIEGLQDAIDFAAVPTGDVTFSITSNVSWSISQKDLDWVSITPSRGLGRNETAVVTISPDVNNDFEARQGTFTLNAGTVSRTVTLSQAAADVEPVFNVDGTEGDTFYVEALDIEGGSFNVSSNRDWTADVNGVSWATVTPLKGEKNRSATISVIPKTVNDDEVREGTISFDYGAAAPKVIKLVHKKFQPEITISVAEMTAIKTGRIADPVVVVTSNAPWTATCSEEWLTVDKTEGELGDTEVTVSAGVNNTGEDRTATVTFANKSVTAVLTVTQGNEFVQASVERISTSDAKATFDVSANVDWTVTSSESWATVDPAEGSGNGTVTVTFAPLTPGVPSRTAEITLAAKSIEGLSSVVTVEQKEPLKLNFIDLYETPVLFNCSQYPWNTINNPGFATAGQTGTESKIPTGQTLFGTGEGTGSARSYSHYENTDVYMKVLDAETDGHKTVLFIMPGDGAWTINKTWTDDAFVFHIPVMRLDYGSILNFDYGLIQGGSNAPRIWNSEVSFDGGATWNSFDTGNTATSPNNGATGNTVLTAKTKKTNYYKGTYQMAEGVQDVDVMVRVRSVDAAHGWSGTAIKSISSPQSTSIRMIGGDGHPWVEGTTLSEVYGPKIYVTRDEAVFVPELSLSSQTLSATGTVASFNVTSNVDWAVTSSESWATVAPAEGTGNGSVTVTMTELEPGADNRTVAITVSAKEYDGYSETVFIEQIAPQLDAKYVDLYAAPVMFNSSQYEWATKNNPDWATAGESGTAAKPNADYPGVVGSGLGLGQAYSYTHYENKEIMLKFVDIVEAPQTSPAVFMMPGDAAFTTKGWWTDDAFQFQIPVAKLEAGSILHFDFSLMGGGGNIPILFMAELSFDGGQTWTPFETGKMEAGPNTGFKGNCVMTGKQKTVNPFETTYVIPETVRGIYMLARIRIADASHTLDKNGKVGTTTKPSSTSIRLFGTGYTFAEGKSDANPYGPKFYATK